ncbi:DsbA family protein [Patescibacteria group bacterium]
MSPKKKKSAFKFNPWILVSVIAVIAFAGFIFYDKSPTFHNNVNFVFGIEDDIFPEIHKVKLTVLTDPSFENPAYDLDEKVAAIEEELGTEAELKIEMLDINDDKGKEIVEKLDLKTYPLFLFDKEFSETELYKGLIGFFVEEDDYFVLRLQPYGYLQFPEVGDGHVKGILTDDAPIRIVEYSSFSCTYCARMKDVFAQALTEYPDKIQFVYKHFDRGGIDQFLAHMSECADEQGKFWEMHDHIFDNIAETQNSDADTVMNLFATQVGLDAQLFQSCMDETRYTQKITGQTQEGYTFAITGTPGIFVNDKFIGGAIDYANLKTIIDSFTP